MPYNSALDKKRPSTNSASGKGESFKEAFARNRKAGKSTFTWNGKSYTTKLKDESKSKAKTKAPASGKSGSTTVGGVKVETRPNSAATEAANARIRKQSAESNARRGGTNVKVK